MASLTLRNIPDDLLEQFRADAKRERRSLNSELLCLLEQAAEQRRAKLRRGTKEERIARLKAFTDTLPYDPDLTPEGISRVLDEDRP